MKLGLRKIPYFCHFTLVTQTVLTTQRVKETGYLKRESFAFALLKMASRRYGILPRAVISRLTLVPTQGIIGSG